MINLLPQEEKKKINIKYKKSLASIWMSSFIILLFISCILIFSSYLIIYTERKNIEERIEVIKKEDKENGRSYQDNLEELKQKMTILLKADNKYPATYIISEVIGVKTIGISIENINYVKNNSKNEKDEVTINGFSNTREDLISFLRNLETLEIIDSAESPVSSLAKSHDIDFSISARIKNRE